MVAERPHLSVVIPVYNESRRLPATMTRVLGYLRDAPHAWEVVVADDGSTDTSAEIVRSFAESDARVRLVQCPHRGKGAAVRAGMLAATGTWRLFTDADLSIELSELPRFFEVPADVAIGSRQVTGARRIGEPSSRHLMGRVFNLCAQALLVPGITDTQCGCKLFSDTAAQHVFSASRIDGFAFDVEVLFLAQKAGLRVREVPLTWHYRPGSRLRLSTGISAFGQLLEIWMQARRGRYREIESSAPLGHRE